MCITGRFLDKFVHPLYPRKKIYNESNFQDHHSSESAEKCDVAGLKL